MKTLKEKLQELDYQTLWDLWDVHINQNSELPKEWQIIDELSDLADGDSDVEQAILSAIENPESDDETSDNVTPKSPIIITIQGGCIYAVDNVPSDKIVEVHDYDIEGETSDDNLKIDSDGNQYILSIY
jgi:hypothetical protein